MALGSAPENAGDPVGVVGQDAEVGHLATDPAQHRREHEAVGVV